MKLLLVGGLLDKELRLIYSELSALHAHERIIAAVNSSKVVPQPVQFA